MSSQTFSTFSEVGMIDARGQNGIITLPLTTDIPYRILTLKDIYGAAALSSITLTTQGADVFEDGTTSRLLNGAFETTTLYAGQAGFWYVTGGSRLATAAIGLLSTGVIANPLRLGTLSTQTAIQFPGLRTNYTGTVVAGQGTGVGTQELLLYQASSISDQIRLQTTGNIVFEAGAAARSWPSTAALVTPTLYIAGTTSNVGIGTASPATTLDVAGTGRFQVVSTQALTVSTINGQTFGQPINSTVIGLGTAGYISSSQLNSTVSGLIITAASAFTGSTVSLSSGSIFTSTITISGALNMTGNNLNIVGTTQTSALLVASTFSTTFINATFISTAALQVSTINGEAFTAATPFTGSTLSLSTASIFTSSLRASTISVGGGAWMSNDGLYLSNVQAGGAVGKLITNAGYVKLVTATAWNGGYGAFAITGGDLTPKIYMNAGQAATGAQMAIGGFNPSPGAGISLDVFGTGRFSSISSFQAVTSSMGVGTATPQALLDVAGTARFQFISTLSLQTSSINGAAPWQQSYLTSTTEGLGTLGYISSTQLGSTVTNLITRIGVGGGGGGTTFVGSTTFLSATQVLFSTQTGYNISSVLGYVSSLQVDELQIGTGYGIIAFGDTNMSSISTLGIAAGLGNFQTINVSSINGAIPGTGTGSATSNFGTVSSLTALRFYGLTGGYTNTVIAEVSTGTGTQELLLYKVSSIADQVRVQTTGNVIFETGVGARGWPVATRATVPTFYVAGSNSNVGIGTSNPLTTLDVAGTGRFQTLSSLNITAGSINYSVAFV